MSKTSSASKIKMKSFEDLFGTNEVVGAKNISGEIRDIPLNSLHTFRNHPFKVREEKLDELVESVKQHGVLVPGIARMRPQGGYEIIAGHTRKAACELAGLDTMPMFIRNLNDDEATIVMVDSNIQREDILPSERARAYSMRYYAMKHQGNRMGNKLVFDYFFGKESEMFSFYRIPRMLIKDPNFSHLSCEAKLLYGLMLDRMALSQRNGWHDDDNRTYIIYTIDEAAADLNCGRGKAIRVVKK